MLSRQEANTMCHLASAQYWDQPAGWNTGHHFLAFGRLFCTDRISNCPSDRVLTYKNLIYLLNLQISGTHTSVQSNVCVCVVFWSPKTFCYLNYKAFIASCFGVIFMFSIINIQTSDWVDFSCFITESIYLFIWGFMSLLKLYQSYHNR